jgi:hypothetical protein
MCRWKLNPKLLYVLAVSFPILVYVLFCIPYINTIGLNYDEAGFVNAALGGITEDWIYKRVFGFPVMIWPYIGALKSFIYYPLFKVVDVSVLSIRLPMVLISILTLIIWFKNSKFFLTGNLFPILFLFLLATDPTFIYYSKLDFGPVVLQTLLMALAFNLSLQFIKQKTPAYLFWTFFLMGVGIYNKFNFLWFVLACLLSFLINYPKEIIFIYKKNPAAVSTIFIFFMGMLSLFVVFILIPTAMNFAFGSALPYIPRSTLSEQIQYISFRTIQMSSLFFNTMNSSATYYSIFNRKIQTLSFINISGIIAFVLWLFCLIVSKSISIKNLVYRQCNSHVLFLLTLLSILFVEIILTPEARLPYHMMILWPLPQLLLFVMLQSVACLLSKFHMKYLICVLSLVVIFSQINVDRDYLMSFRNPNGSRDPQWSSAVFDLSQYVNLHINEFDGALSVGVSPNNQLLALSLTNNDRTKFHDIWWFFLNESPEKKMFGFFHPKFNQGSNANLEWINKNYFIKKNNLIIINAFGKDLPVNANFFAFAKKYSIQLSPLTNIYNGSNELIYSLYLASG